MLVFLDQHRGPPGVYILSTRCVSILPATYSAFWVSRLKKSMLVLIPSMTNSSSARRSRASAAGRFSAWTISFASSES